MKASQLLGSRTRMKNCLCSAVFVAISILTVSLAMLTQPSSAADTCSRVISYFLFPYQGSKIQNEEWRILDPSRGTDTLFLSLPRGFAQVRWDTTFDHVYFSTGDSIYSAEWRLGAKPRFIVGLPGGDGPWWFNRDSASWQFLRLREQTNTEGKDNLELSRKGGELLESEGGTWKLIRSDSVYYYDDPRDHGEWVDGSPVPKGIAVVTLDDLASDAWSETWLEKSAFFDTSTITVTKGVPGDGHSSDQWFFLRLESAPQRGIAYQFLDSTAPEGDWSGIYGPVYFVDLERRTKTLVAGDDGIRRSLAAERCGFVLIPGVGGNPSVIDSAGQRVFAAPWNSNDAVWAPRPRR